MSFVKVMRLSELPPGSIFELEIAGAAYAVCNVAGTLHCVDGTCPHAGGPLAQGNLDGSNLVCPWHGWEFDTRTGVNTYDEECVLRTYPVSVENDQIIVELP